MPQQALWLATQHPQVGMARSRVCTSGLDKWRSNCVAAAVPRRRRPQLRPAPSRFADPRGVAGQRVCTNTSTAGCGRRRRELLARRRLSPEHLQTPAALSYLSSASL